MENNKYILIYYPFPFDVKLNVGSGVRMTNILREFIRFGQDSDIKVFFISGNQFERLKLYKKLKNINPKDILYCYIELPNIPLLLSNKNHIPTVPTIDSMFFKYLKKNEIPFGGFLRDIYWMFNDMYPLKGIVKHIMIILNNYYLKLYKKYFSIVFLPSIKMNDYVLADTKKMYPLPSGGQLRISERDFLDKGQDNNWKAIYVGSLHETAGTIELLKAFEYYNSIGKKTVELTFVCRENEYLQKKSWFESFENYKWLKILHLDSNSEELCLQYLSADFAVVPYSKNKYNDFAMPVKVIEYISYGLPILSTNLTAVSNFIKDNKCGCVVREDSQSISTGISEIINLIKKGTLKKSTILKNFQQNHTWRSRILEIDKKLREVDIRI